MRTIFKCCVVLTACCFSISCIDDESNSERIEGNEILTINYENAFNNRIGVVSSSESDEFIDIKKSQLINYWKKNLELSDETKFNEIRLVKAEIEEGEKQYYMLNTIAENKGVYMNINTKVSLTKDGFLMRGETCVCESTNCNFGCEVLSMCRCSSCARPGVCKKKHTLTSNPTFTDL